MHLSKSAFELRH